MKRKTPWFQLPRTGQYSVAVDSSGLPECQVTLAGLVSFAIDTACGLVSFAIDTACAISTRIRELPSAAASSTHQRAVS